MSVNNLAVPGEGSFSADGIEDLTALPYLYARWTNPTVRALEERMAALEGAEDALATATGVAALAAIFLTFLKAGDHLIVSDVCYAGANELARRILPDFGIEVTPVNMARLELVEAAMRPNTRLVHCESPVNPILRIVDLEALAAHRGSVLGNLPDAPQPPQKLFDSQVWHALRGFDPARPVFAEAESRRIGLVTVPDALIDRLRAGAAGKQAA